MDIKIGDWIWSASAGQEETWITCPDCMGTKRIRVIMGDDTELSIDCAGCASGYEPPRGVICEYKFKARVCEYVVKGLQIYPEGKTTYYTQENHCVDGENAFRTKLEAEVRAHELIKERAEQERNRLLKREKPTRTWAWNAHYHRRCIRQAKKDLAYHSGKLCVAATKAKDDRAVASGQGPI